MLRQGARLMFATAHTSARRPMNLISLHDTSGGQVPRVERCLKVICNFPVDCIGCRSYVVTCTVALTAAPVAIQPAALVTGRARFFRLWSCVPLDDFGLLAAATAIRRLVQVRDRKWETLRGITC